MVLVENDAPTLEMQRVYEWMERCEATCTPVVDDEEAGVKSITYKRVSGRVLFRPLSP